jgi:hypothetical protein
MKGKGERRCSLLDEGSETKSCRERGWCEREKRSNGPNESGPTKVLPEPERSSPTNVDQEELEQIAYISSRRLLQQRQPPSSPLNPSTHHLHSIAKSADRTPIDLH